MSLRTYRGFNQYLVGVTEYFEFFLIWIKNQTVKVTTHANNNVGTK